MRTLYESEIIAATKATPVSADLIEALVLTESAGDTWAYNPEPKYRYFWDVKQGRPFRALTEAEIDRKTPPADFPTLAGDRDQEWWAQQASWGLCQIMGAVAREHGFIGKYLPALCDPAVNLALAVKHLSGLLKWSEGNEAQALAAYNGGKGGNSQLPYRNASYAAKVLSRLA